MGSGSQGRGSGRSQRLRPLRAFGFCFRSRVRGKVTGSFPGVKNTSTAADGAGAGVIGGEAGAHRVGDGCSGVIAAQKGLKTPSS